MAKSFNKEALKYHSDIKPGKVDVRSSKSCDTEYDLSLAYSPGVAAPCKEIFKNLALPVLSAFSNLASQPQVRNLYSLACQVCNLGKCQN